MTLYKVKNSANTSIQPYRIESDGQYLACYNLKEIDYDDLSSMDLSAKDNSWFKRIFTYPTDSCVVFVEKLKEIHPEEFI